MRNVRRLGSLVTGAALLTALFGFGTPSASAAPRFENCNTYPGNPNFWACISVQGNEVVGNGHVGNQSAVMWIQICRYRSATCYGTKRGWEIRLPVSSLPAGRYVTSFYHSGGHGAVDSRDIEIGPCTVC